MNTYFATSTNFASPGTPHTAQVYAETQEDAWTQLNASGFEPFEVRELRGDDHDVVNTRCDMWARAREQEGDAL